MTGIYLLVWFPNVAGLGTGLWYFLAFDIIFAPHLGINLFLSSLTA